MSAGLELLLKASEFAADLAEPVKEFAVEIRRLRAVGLTECHLRWLLRKGFIEHFFDSTLPGESGRSLRPLPTLRFLKSSCFALTDAGIRLTVDIQASAQMRSGNEADTPEHGNGVCPIWTKELRQLSFNNTIIKKYQGPARNQERILSAFEEEHWPQSIDDPLPPLPGVESVDRLNKTIYRLNRSLHPPLIHFSCNGGDSVQWGSTLVDTVPPLMTPRRPGRH